MRFVRLMVMCGFVWAIAVAGTEAATITLGTFNFDSNLFGNTLVESDGGTFRAGNWLNVVNADPGNPGALTGANFDTGVANIGLTGDPLYTIGYSTPIVNGSGNDLAIVDANYSTSDTYRMAVSTDGVTFSGFQSFSNLSFTNTGVGRNYFYGFAGPFSSELTVLPIDLSLFGIAAGDSIVAVKITGSPEADLIRVAGFTGGETTGNETTGGETTGGGEVPEPASLVLLGSGLAGAIAARRRRR